MGPADHEYLKVWLSHAITGVAASIAIILRFVARRRTKAKLQWDDWLAVSALLFMWGDFACTIIEHVPRINKIPSRELSVADQNMKLRSAYASILTTDACEVLARLSVICLYRRLFSVKRWLERSVKAVGILSILWLLTLVFTVSFQCKPVVALIDASVKGDCLNNQTGFLSSEIFNAALDLTLVCLPIRIIMKLNLPVRERLGIGLIFVTGGLVIITGIIRMAYGYRPGTEGSTTSMSSLSLWTGLHLGFAVICTSLPVFRVFLPKDDAFFVTRVRLLYRSISGWVCKSSSTPKPTAPSLPSFVNPDRKAPIPSVVYPNEILLTTNDSSISRIDRLVAEEYHRTANT